MASTTRAAQTISQMMLPLMAWPIAFQVMFSVGIWPVRMKGSTGISASKAPMTCD